MIQEQISNPPTGWVKLKRGDRDSNVAWFRGGYAHVNGVSVLIWRGDEREDGTVVIDTSNSRYDEGRHEFIIEVMNNDHKTREYFSETPEGAWKIANSLILEGKPFRLKTSQG